MNGIYASVVGTTYTGTLQPWLALAQQYGPIATTLFHTPETRLAAEHLAAYAESHNLGSVTLDEVNTGSHGAGSAPEKIATLATQLNRQQRIYYNVMGGMGYQMVATAIELLPLSPVLVITSRWHIYEYDPHTREVRDLPFPSPLKVEDLLELQNIEWSFFSPRIPEGGRDIFTLNRENLLKLPENRLENISIAGNHFDVAWNPGNNTLALLTDRRNLAAFNPESEKAARREWFKNADRKLCNFALSRENCAQLFDKTIYAVAADEHSLDLLRNDSQEKITVIASNECQENGIDLGRKLHDCFQRKASTGTPKKARKTAPVEENTDLLPDDTLVTYIGTNLGPTLKAICSHKPRHLVLCHTSAPGIRKYVENIKAYKADLGLESVTSLEVPFDCFDLPKRLPKLPLGETRRVRVNITPGAKPHRLLLGLWANDYGLERWSLNQKARQCSPLDKPELGLPLCNPDPILFLSIRGAEIQREKLTKLEEMADRQLYTDLLQFMRDAITSGQSDSLFKRPVCLANRSLRKSSTGVLEFTNDRGQKLALSYDRGKSFENLCAVAFAEAGGEDVYLNVAKSWSERLQTREEIRHAALIDGVPVRPHATEWDVVGNHNGETVLISCKSNPNADEAQIEKDIQDALTAGAILHHFAFRILAHMSCHTPGLKSDRVMLIGWRELCQPDKLKGLIRKLQISQRTTAGAEDE